MSAYVSSDVLCPFYIKVKNNQCVVCEGVQANSTIHLAFADKGKCAAYMNKHCCSDYKHCRIYEILNDKYK